LGSVQLFPGRIEVDHLALIVGVSILTLFVTFDLGGWLTSGYLSH